MIGEFVDLDHHEQGGFLRGRISAVLEGVCSFPDILTCVAYVLEIRFMTTDACSCAIHT